MAVTGVTHFNKVSAKTVGYAGAAGSEAIRYDTTGCWTGAAGSEYRLDTVGTLTWVVNLAGASTAAQGAYIAVPYACTLVSAYGVVSSGTVGSGASTTITLTDTAGAAQFGTASFTSTGTAGSQTITYGTMSTASIAAAGVICIAMASCATAYGATFSITATKTPLTV